MTYSYLFIITCNLLFIFYLKYVEATLDPEKIVGGDVASVGQFKYQVSILDYDQHICGGGIIGERFVLTAAHCILNNKNNFQENKRYSIVAKIIDITNPKGHLLLIPVRKAYVPKGSIHSVSPRNTLHRHVADIAVLKLKYGFKLESDKEVLMLQLPNTNLLYMNENPIISGFGYEAVTVMHNPITKEDSEIPKTALYRLKYSKTTVISNEVCRRNIPFLEPSHICAQTEQRRGNPFSGVCIGDSGSPLVLENNIVIGVLSYSPFGCDETYTPAVYTRVSSYLTFIHNAMHEVDLSLIHSYDYLV